MAPGRAVSARTRAARREVPAPLRRDVRLLGRLLGRVLVESGGPELLRDVERLRRAAIALREHPGEDRRRAVVEAVSGLGPERAAEVARAFTAYFELVNLAEERHRIRVLRERGRRWGQVSESIAEAVRAVREAEGDPALGRLLSRLRIHPVLTAHPTEARRRAVVECLQRISALLEVLDDPRVPRSDQEAARRRLLEEITTLWRTDRLRRRAPGPLDEVRATLAFFDHTLFRLVPLVYRELERALDPEGAGTRPPSFPAFLRWGSWVGGDRDGNPLVTGEVTRAAADVHAEHVLRGLEAVCRRIARGATASARTTPPSPDLLASLDADRERFPALGAELSERIPDQPHRARLLLVAERLAATRLGRPGAYGGVEEFLADLRQVQRSLAGAGAHRLAYGELQDLVWQAETFGFHLASLEVRQHSGVHAAVLRELVPEVASDLRALDRLGFGSEARPALPDRLSPQAEEVLETFRAVADIQARHGPEACRRYVVSFTRSPADLAAVPALARLALGDREVELDVVPLFESKADLLAAPRILEGALALPGLAARVTERGELEVMLGYSDSAKEMGFLAANLALYRTQAALARWARVRGLGLTLFHGRGGALGRGGGPANRAILSQAPGSVGGRFKVTEQGEVVFARYGHLAIARRHLEQVTNAVLLASGRGVVDGVEGSLERFEEPAQRMAAASERAYRDLVEGPGFPEFFARVTPVEEIERLQIGSRPARRQAPPTLESLRAIPWVFAWTQSRINLPGWYGLGSGLAEVAEGPGGMATLRAMYEDWPFLRVVLENAELSLVKADLPIAQMYLSLGDRPDLARRIEEEYTRTRDLVLAVSGHAELLEERPVLRRAVELRNPYVDVLSFLQVRFLRDLRTGRLGPEEAERAERLVMVTVNGVAAGLQNTG